MEYTVNEIASMAGISSRTIRYYDEIDLLNPDYINDSGYRIYKDIQVDLLQQILFYKELNFSLDKIKEIIHSNNFDISKALIDHKNKLLKKKKRIDTLINIIDKTILFQKGELKMSNKEKFEGFKKELVKDNKEKYGKEVVKKYGESTFNESNKKLLNMTEQEYEENVKLQEEFNDTLKRAVKNGDPTSDIAKKACKLHKDWISFYWPKYTKEAHLGLVEMYVYDGRFKKHYEKIHEGATEFLLKAMKSYLA